jgi:hypothetical protein
MNLDAVELVFRALVAGAGRELAEIGRRWSGGGASGEFSSACGDVFVPCGDLAVARDRFGCRGRFQRGDFSVHFRKLPHQGGGVAATRQHSGELCLQFGALGA